jgi:hypothetical protein
MDTQLSGQLTGIAFFPGDAQQRAIVAVTYIGLAVVTITSPTSISVSTTATWSTINDLQVVAIAPSGTTAMVATNSDNLLNYFATTYTAITLLQ